MPHFGAVLTPIRIVAEVNNYDREMEPTEPEVNIQERGLEFSPPKPSRPTVPARCLICGNDAGAWHHEKLAGECERSLKSSEKSQRAHQSRRENYNSRD